MAVVGVGAGVSALAALAGQVTANRAEGRRATAAHGRDEAARAAEHAQRYAESQRATLHDLQEAVVELLDLLLTLALTPPELDEISGQNLRQYLLAARIKMLTQRVADDSSRAEVESAAEVLEEYTASGCRSSAANFDTTR